MTFATIKKGDVLERKTGFEIKDHWSRIFVQRKDSAFNMVAILPASLMYARVGDDVEESDLSPVWRRVDTLLDEYNIVEEGK